MSKYSYTNETFWDFNLSELCAKIQELIEQGLTPNLSTEVVTWMRLEQIIQNLLLSSFSFVYAKVSS